MNATGRPKRLQTVEQLALHRARLREQQPDVPEDQEAVPME